MAKIEYSKKYGGGLATLTLKNGATEQLTQRELGKLVADAAALLALGSTTLRPDFLFPSSYDKD